MKTKHALPIIISLFLIIFICTSAKKENGVKITYIAQSGVFIESDTIKIFIDALFKKDPRWGYPAPSQELLDSIERALPPYNNISIFLVTHAHIDHFDPKSLEKALMHNPKSVLVTTPEVKNIMIKWCQDFKGIESRVIAPIIKYKSSLDTLVRGIPLRINHLKHHDDKEWQAMVYAYLINVNGKKILHNGGSTGYFPDEYEVARYDTMGIDVAILYHHFLSGSNSSGTTVIDNYIKPKNILLGHIGPENKSFMDSLKIKFKDKYPTLSVLTNSGESWKY
jgi:L-ascorbate metabolism protein UlaG (beta-lactamase superfamily)